MFNITRKIKNLATKNPISRSAMRLKRKVSNIFSSDMQIVNITHSRLLIERLFPETHKETCKYFLDEHNIQLPTYKSIKAHSIYPDDVRVILKDFATRIETKTEFIDILFKRGGLTDFGSVPKKARGVVPYDGLKYIVGYLAHDCLFASSAGFNFSNDLLKEILRYNGVTFRKLNYVFYAVQWGAKDAYTPSQYVGSRSKQFVTVTRTKKK